MTTLNGPRRLPGENDDDEAFIEGVINETRSFKTMQALGSIESRNALAYICPPKMKLVNEILDMNKNIYTIGIKFDLSNHFFKMRKNH
ncbi:MAG: hypothetical protein SV375_19050, partial [Thermodesulfobacteriota bacterium]|nr:hypothetical protein [Thermodesulfobacteriota bacterium]